MGQDQDLEERNQQLLDDVEAMNEKIQNMRNEMNDINKNKAPGLRKSMAMNQMQLGPAKATYNAKVNLKKQEEIQALSKVLNECNDSKISLLKDKAMLDIKLNKLKEEVKYLNGVLSSVTKQHTKLQAETAKVAAEHSKIKGEYDRYNMQLQEVKQKHAACYNR